MHQKLLGAVVGLVFAGMVPAASAATIGFNDFSGNEFVETFTELDPHDGASPHLF